MIKVSATRRGDTGEYSTSSGRHFARATVPRATFYTVGWYISEARGDLFVKATCLFESAMYICILKKNKICKSGIRNRNQRFDNSNRAIHSALTTELTRQHRNCRGQCVFI